MIRWSHHHLPKVSVGNTEMRVYLIRAKKKRIRAEKKRPSQENVYSRRKKADPCGKRSVSAPKKAFHAGKKRIRAEKKSSPFQFHVCRKSINDPTRPDLIQPAAKRLKNY